MAVKKKRGILSLSLSLLFLFETKASISFHLSQKRKRIKFVFTRMSAGCFNTESGAGCSGSGGGTGDKANNESRGTGSQECMDKFLCPPSGAGRGQLEQMRDPGGKRRASEGPCRHHCYKNLLTSMPSKLGPTWAAPVPESH